MIEYDYLIANNTKNYFHCIACPPVVVDPNFSCRNVDGRQRVQRLGPCFVFDMVIDPFALACVSVYAFVLLYRVFVRAWYICVRLSKSVVAYLFP